MNHPQVIDTLVYFSVHPKQNKGVFHTWFNPKKGRCTTLVEYDRTLSSAN